MSSTAKPVSIILCGGKTSRFGGNKANACVGGRQVIERIFRVLEPISSRIIAVTSDSNTEIRLPGDALVVADVYPGMGPLGGLYTGLLNADSDRVLLVGCDMPFLNAGLISLMFSLVDGYDAVAPRLDSEYIEPLHTIYARACLDRIKSRLERGQQSLWPVLKEVNTRYLEREEYLPLDPLMLSFFNINVPEDLEYANRIAAQMDNDIICNK
jgi:molybdopterin-guanine dinucleotide biosynthesis protein A